MSQQKMRLIQAGVGAMGKAWWMNATKDSPDFELVALVDPAEPAMKEAAAALKLPAERQFKSLEEALAKVPADAVLTVTPPAIHVEHAKLTFAKGMHLLTEKPIAHDLPAAKLMVELAKRAGKQLMVAQNYRYGPSMTKLRQTMSEKPVGDLGHGHIDFYIPADFTGTFRETMDYPLLVDMSIHHMDLIRAVTGRSIRKVTAQTFKPAWSWYKHDPGLKMLLELEGDGGGATWPFSYSGDWSARGKTTSWNGNWRLQCDTGSIEMLDEKLSIWRCEKWGKDPTTAWIDIPAIPENGQQILLKNFANAIRSNTPAETSGADNIWSFGAVMAGVISTREKRTVDVGELIEKTPLPS